MDEKGLGERLQQARKSVGYTQQELCQKSGLSYSTLAKIERGAIKSPSIFTIQQIAAALNTTVDALMGDVVSQNGGKKQSKNGVSFVYFDVNGCLVHLVERAFAAVALDTGVSPDVAEETYLRYNSAVCRGNMTLEDFNAILASSFEIEKLEWFDYYINAIKSIEASGSMLEWAAKHYRVGLLTNIMPGFLDGIREKHYIPNINFDTIIDSSVVGMIKPEPAIYKLAAERAGVEPAEILFIDDTQENLVFAEKAGWQTLHFDNTNPAESVRRIKDALAF